MSVQTESESKGREVMKKKIIKEVSMKFSEKDSET